MADQPRPDADQLTRQTRQHLASLQAAGVEWLPAAPQPAEPPAPAEEPSSALSAASPAPVQVARTLWDAEDETPRETHMASPEQRRVALEVLSQRVAQCMRCAELASTRTQTVFGEGPLDAEVCFIGEAPGADEDAMGRPFVGRAGQLLDRIIAAMGFRREEVYICNILRCRPPGNRLPLPNEAANCREYLDETLELVRPKYIVALGACAAQNLLGTTLAIGKLRGQFQSYRGIPVLCTYHPAFLLRSPDRKRDVWEDLQKLLTRMGRPVPRK